jgi:hypothetical protein
VHQLAQSGHLNWNAGGHLHWVLILEHSDYFRTLPGFLRKSGGASGFWPGTGEVDIVAADGYNHQGCKDSDSKHGDSKHGGSKHGGSKQGGAAASVTPEDLFDPVLSFAQSHGGLPVFIAEWGSQANEGSEQATFITQMQGFVAANHEIAAVSYFDWRSAQNRACTSVINNQPASLAAMAAMGHSAPLQGHVVGAQT